MMVPGEGIEPTRLFRATDFESAASTSSAIPARGRQYSNPRILRPFAPGPHLDLETCKDSPKSKFRPTMLAAARAGDAAARRVLFERVAPATLGIIRRLVAHRAAGRGPAAGHADRDVRASARIFAARRRSASGCGRSPSAAASWRSVRPGIARASRSSRWTDSRSCCRVGARRPRLAISSISIVRSRACRRSRARWCGCTTSKAGRTRRSRSPSIAR